MKLNKRLLSPAKLFVFTWVFATIAAYFGSEEMVYNRYNVIESTFTPSGIIWIMLATGSFILGIKMANQKQIIFNSRPKAATSNKNNLENWRIKIAKPIIFSLAIFICLLLILWTMLTIRQIGSASSAVTLLQENWHYAGDLWVEQKPFFGARLLYTGLISIVLFAISGICNIKNKQPGKKESESYLSWIFLLFLGIAPLLILPLIVSQRLLLATALVSSIIYYALYNENGLSFRYPLIGAVTGISVWVAQESVRSPNTTGIVDSVYHGLNKFLYYFTNDIGNLNRAVAHISEHTYGSRSFKFILRYLFIEEKINSTLFQSFYDNVDSVLAGGTFTTLGEPYVDFGVFGLVLILVWGYVSQVTYIFSGDNMIATQIYALLAASIILSWHFLLWGNVLFWFNLIILFSALVIVPNIYLRTKYEKSGAT